MTVGKRVPEAVAHSVGLSVALMLGKKEGLTVVLSDADCEVLTLLLGQCIVVAHVVTLGLEEPLKEPVKEVVCVAEVLRVPERESLMVVDTEPMLQVEAVWEGLTVVLEVEQRLTVWHWLKDWSLDSLYPDGDTVVHCVALAHCKGEADPEVHENALVEGVMYVEAVAVPHWEEKLGKPAAVLKTLGERLAVPDEHRVGEHEELSVEDREEENVSVAHCKTKAVGVLL